jgi:hypothetical protein
MIIADELQRVIYYDKPAGLTVDEIASATATHPRTVYYYIEGEKKVPVEWLVKASRYLMDVYGDTRLAALFLGPRHVIIPSGTPVINGDLSDEITGAVSALGHAVDAFGDDDCRSCEQAADAIITQAVRIKAEAKAKQKGRSGR